MQANTDNPNHLHLPQCRDSQDSQAFLLFDDIEIKFNKMSLLGEKKQSDKEKKSKAIKKKKQKR